jgi:hypothetical protein
MHGGQRWLDTRWLLLDAREIKVCAARSATLCAARYSLLENTSNCGQPSLLVNQHSLGSRDKAITGDTLLTPFLPGSTIVIPKPVSPHFVLTIFGDRCAALRLSELHQFFLLSTVVALNILLAT